VAFWYQQGYPWEDNQDAAPQEVAALEVAEVGKLLEVLMEVWDMDQHYQDKHPPTKLPSSCELSSDCPATLLLVPF